VLHGSPPDLSALHVWGCTIWVHDPTGLKLDTCACKGRWLGFDVELQAHCVYWPDRRNVSVERSVYFGSSAQLEGEELLIPQVSEQTATPTVPPAPTTPTALPPPAPATAAPAAPPLPVPTTPVPATLPPPVSDAPPDSSPVESTLISINTPTLHPTCTCKPSCILHTIQSGEGVTSAQAKDPCFAQGLQLPGSFIEESEEAGGAWYVADGTPVLLDDFEGLKIALVAETSDTEALEPRTLAEAKRHPDWPLWEKAIEEELATLKAASTWRLEEAPPGANIIGSKWVFKAKKDTVGNIAHYKA
jgi:hypothetical protein